MAKKEKITYLSENSEELAGPIKKTNKKLKECQREKEEYLTQIQRARADLINYRRRQEKALEELRKYGQENLIKELLLVLDSLIIASKEKKGSVENFIKGMEQIKEQLEAVLKKYGLKEIKARGEKFNPEFHEAVDQIASKEKEGTVIEEVQKGYLLGDKVLRASKVKVAK